MSGQLIESHLASITLRNRVGGQQASGAATLQQCFGTEEEVRYVVRVPSLPTRNVLHQIIAVLRAECAGDPLTADERRVPHDGVKAISIDEDFRKLQRPMEGAMRRRN